MFSHFSTFEPYNSEIEHTENTVYTNPKKRPLNNSNEPNNNTKKNNKNGKNVINNTRRNTKRRFIEPISGVIQSAKSFFSPLTDIKSKEKSIYLYIVLHGAIINKPIKTQKFYDSLVKVKFPKKLKHLTKITTGIIGCYNWSKPTLRYDIIQNFKKNVLDYHSYKNSLSFSYEKKTLWDYFNENHTKNISYFKNIIKTIEENISIIKKIIENDTSILEKTPVTKKNNQSIQILKDSILKNNDILLGKTKELKNIKLYLQLLENESRLYREFNYNSGDNDKVLFNKLFSRNLSDLRFPIPATERFLFEDNIESTLNDRNIIVLYDSLGLFQTIKNSKELQGDVITTQKLIDLLVNKGYTHIYLIDPSCNDLYEPTNNIYNSQNYKNLQTLKYIPPTRNPIRAIFGNRPIPKTEKYYY